MGAGHGRPYRRQQRQRRAGAHADPPRPAPYDEKGVPVKLVYSDALRDEAELEAAVHGKSLADYEKQLEDEMAAVQPDAASATLQ